MFSLLSRKVGADIRTLSFDEVESLGCKVLADYSSEKCRELTLRKEISQLKRKGEYFEAVTHQLKSCKESQNILWTDITTVQSHTDVKLLVYQYANVKDSSKKQGPPVSDNAQYAEAPANSNSEGEVEPSAEAVANQTPAASKRKLESENTSPLDEANFKLVTAKKSKNNPI